MGLQWKHAHRGAAERVLSPNLPTTAHAALETSAAVVVVMPADKTTNQLMDEVMYSSDIINNFTDGLHHIEYHLNYRTL